MNYKEFIQKYEELLNSGYCECNELNCLDNNPPKKILNIMKEQQQEIERLNNIINKGIEAINVYQNEKTLSIGYQDLKRIRGILRGNEFDLKIFEEYLQELKGSDKE